MAGVCNRRHPVHSSSGEETLTRPVGTVPSKGVFASLAGFHPDEALARAKRGRKGASGQGAWALAPVSAASGEPVAQVSTANPGHEVARTARPLGPVPQAPG